MASCFFHPQNPSANAEGSKFEENKEENKEVSTTALSTPESSGKTSYAVLDNSNIRDAIQKYFDNEYSEPIGEWKTGHVTKMSYLFKNRFNFNADISRWDVSNVTTMEGMFLGAEKFNQPIGTWKVAKVKNMSYMFYKCEAFNQPLNEWKVDEVRLMEEMFCRAKSFNQPLYKWNVSKVVNMRSMFYKATSFDQSLYRWNAKLQQGAVTSNMFDPKICKKCFNPSIWSKILAKYFTRKGGANFRCGRQKHVSKTKKLPKKHSKTRFQRRK